MRPAVFLDRDNTLIEDPGYLADPNQVRLMPGAAETIRRCKDGGYRVVVVTNQSGLARGLITEAQLREIHDQMETLLKQDQATLDGIYFCPYLDGPEAVVPQYRCDSELRKPKPGMLLKAAEDLDLDLAQSWMIGDSITDVQAGLAAGCNTILLSDDLEDLEDVEADYIVDSLPRAVDVVLGFEPDEACEPVEAPPAPNPPAPATTAPPPPAMPATDGPGDSAAAVELLRDIRTLLRQQDRAALQRDFSVVRLAATLCQIVAVAVMLWGLAAYVSEDAAAIQLSLLRFLLAGILQLLALTLFIIDPSK